MSAQHTPGRLKAHHDHGWLVISDDQDDLYTKVAKGLGSSVDKANARRLVACWNACEMVSTEDLEALTRPGDVSWACTIDRVVRERDELLTALGDCRDAMPDTTANINEAIAFPTSVPAYVRESVSLLTARSDELLTWLRWAAKLLPEDVRSSWQYEQAQAAIAKAEVAA